MATEDTQVSSYGPISATMQVTQTLPVQTEPSTQLLSHEVPQFTQLVDHDSVEHAYGDTLINSGDLEGSGNTLVLHDDASPFESKGGASASDQRNDLHGSLQAAAPLQAGVSSKKELHNGTTAEDCGEINMSALDPPKKYITSNIPDSDATTEEAENNGFGLLSEEADAESLLHTTVDIAGDVAPQDLGGQSNVSPTLATGVTSTKFSQLGPTSFQTVPFDDLGPLAANQNALSFHSARKEDARFDSNATVELIPEVRNCELKDHPFQASEGVLGPTQDPSTDKAACLDSTQSLLKPVEPPLDATMHSPHTLTSAFLAPRQAVEQDPAYGRINESDKVIRSKGLSSYGRAPEMPVDRPQSTSTALEPVTEGPKRQHSQESTKKPDQDSATNNEGPGVSTTRHPSPQYAGEVVTDKLANQEDAVSKVLQTEGENATGEFVSVTHAPVREQRLSLPTNLSYLGSQEPGEETQLNAFNVVDKLVWLDTTCVPDDIVISPVPHDSPIKDHASTKGLRPLAQAAQMKTVRDNLDVFDWQDSQVNQVCTAPDVNQKHVDVGFRKQHSEAHKPVEARKKQATSQRKRKAITYQMEKKDNDSTTSAEDVAQTQVPKLDGIKNSLEKKPHTLLTTRLRNRMKAESRPLAKGTKGSSLKGGPIKRAGKESGSDEFGRDFETKYQKASDNNKASENNEVMVQQAGPNVKDEFGKRGGRKKSVDELGKDLKTELLNGNDNKKAELQQSGPRAKGEARKRASGKNAVDEVGKELKVEQSNANDSKGKNSLQAASLGANSEVEPPKNPQVSLEGRQSVRLAERTSQDDAAADIWIEAFASAKNKSALKSSDVELVKFRKRSATHNDTGQDSKKHRSLEASAVDVNLKEKAPLKENRADSEKLRRGLKTSENIDALKISRRGGRRGGTRSHGQDENQELVKKENTSMKEKQLTTEPQSPKTDDAQVKTRRISNRSSGGKHQDASVGEDILMTENKVELGFKTRQDQKQCKVAEVKTVPSIKSQRVSTRSSKQENVNIAEQAGSAKNESTLKRGRKAKSRAQHAERVVVGSDVEEGNRVKNDVNKSIAAQMTTSEKDEQSLPSEAMQGGLILVKPSIKTRRSKQKEDLLSHQHSTNELDQDAKEIEASPCQAGPSLIDVNNGLATEAPKRRNRRVEVNVRASKSAKASRKSVPQPKEDTDKSTLKIKESVGSQRGDVSKPILLRRTRRNTHDDGSPKIDFVDVNKDQGRFCGESTPEKKRPQNSKGMLDDKKGSKEEAKMSEIKTAKSTPRGSKKKSVSERVEKLDSADRAKRRKTEPGSIRVLFSHSLTEDMIKHQKKILAKLGGQLATSAADCTHFVSNGFVRTQNMLISMAAGKIVATPLWLENCGQANYFVDARKYVLQDDKKEKELGFSMIASLASAERKPLLKGVQMLVCPNTVPEPEVLRAIVENAGGQVMDIKSSSSLLDAKESGVLSVVIANEKDFDFCLPFLGKGLQVYSEELLLHGIVTQSLDFTRHRLFEDFKQRQGRTRAAKGSA